MKTVFVAMSGGIDSSFAAYLLKEEGYNVVGVTFQLLPSVVKDGVNPKACCSIETVNRARSVATTLSIPHYVIDLRDEFERFVIRNFIEEYRAGRTPNPCILCNRHIKFDLFYRKAVSMGADSIATGHYSIIEEDQGGWLLKRGTNRAKDQSYFLYCIPKEHLATTLFPMGHLAKESLWSKSVAIGWNSPVRTESQDICFIPDGYYRRFLSGFIQLREGPIYLINGTRIGTHQGLHLYTIGQRKGLRIPYSEPLYVVRINIEDNALFVGGREELQQRRVLARNINMLAPAVAEATVRARYRQAEVRCTYTSIGDTLDISLSDPLDCVTPGQSVVLYDGETVLGGGVITEGGPRGFPDSC